MQSFIELSAKIEAKLKERNYEVVVKFLEIESRAVSNMSFTAMLELMAKEICKRYGKRQILDSYFYKQYLDSYYCSGGLIAKSPLNNYNCNRSVWQPLEFIEEKETKNIHKVRIDDSIAQWKDIPKLPKDELMFLPKNA